MISTKSISNPALLPSSVSLSFERQPFLRLRLASYESTGHAAIDRLLEQIDCPQIKDIVKTLFGNAFRLIECLSLIESHLRQVDSANETFALFHLIHEDARDLVAFIRTDALSSDSLPQELADTLDGITFVINHELNRVFECDRSDLAVDSTTYAILSKLHRAHDVLTNCLQQSTISLAMVFDETMVGAKLFDNSDMRYKQSLQLCQDLLSLRQLIEDFELQPKQERLSDLIAGIKKFRMESLEGLMYSDWPQFESFCARIEAFTNNLPSLLPVLHQFQCYLETLLTQVRMRAVFTEKRPTPHEASNPFEVCSDGIQEGQETSFENSLVLAL